MRIEWRNKARRQLKKLKDRATIKRILDAVERLELEPSNLDIKALSGHEYSHRLRVGNYRVLLNIDEVIEVAFVEEVKKRDDRTY